MMALSVDWLGSWEHLWATRGEDGELLGVTVIDSTRRGPAFGGIRRRTYASVSDGIADAAALARAMSLKCALADLPAGGAKTVVFDPGSDRIDAAYRIIGRAIDRLGGLYFCGPDIGTGTAELDVVRSETHFVNPIENDAGQSTADGVFAALRGAAQARWGSPDLRGRSIAIEGLGAVGQAFAERVIADGAVAIGFDVDPAACDRAAKIGVSIVEKGEELWMRLFDVIAPCALGGCLTTERISRLATPLICGSANNQLASTDVDQQMSDRGIAYVPDVLANAGAVVQGVWSLTGRDPSEVREKYRESIRGIEGRSERLLIRARTEKCGTQDLATRWALAALDRDATFVAKDAKHKSAGI